MARTRAWERWALAAALVVACGGTPTEAVDQDPACALPTPLGSVAFLQVPAEATVVPGCGRFLVPGLAVRGERVR